MKPFLGIDLTNDKKNEQLNGDEFLVAHPSSTLAQSFEHASKALEETIEKSKLSRPLRNLRWCCGAIGIIFGFRILEKFLDGKSSVAYQNKPWGFWLVGACLVIWGILAFIGIGNEKRVLESQKSRQTFRAFHSVCDAISAELCVPPNAEEVDILSFFYKVKDDEVQVRGRFWLTAPYFNTVLDAFSDSKNLYLVNLEGKYAIPLSSIKSIRTVKKSICMTDWNKDEPYNKGFYKPYKISVDDNGCVHCKYYHIIEFQHESEIWGMYIPCYELPVFEKLTGLTATETI